MADIIRITMGKRMRVEVDGKDETHYLEMEASYQPGEIPVGDSAAAIATLSLKVDRGLDAWVGDAPTTTTTKKNGTARPMSANQKNFIAGLLKDKGADEKTTADILSGIHTVQEADAYIKKLQSEDVL